MKAPHQGWFLGIQIIYNCDNMSKDGDMVVTKTASLQRFQAFFQFVGLS